MLSASSNWRPLGSATAWLGGPGALTGFMAFITRFAPSPTGRIHLGTAASAFHVWRAAEAAGGTVLLRIEDVDQTRCRPEYTQGILEELTWLGLSWPEPVRVQSEHFAAYEVGLEQLRGQGLLYRCFHTRKEMTSLAPDGIYRGGPLSVDEEARRLEVGDAYALRLSLDRAKDALGPDWDRLSYLEETEGGLVERTAHPERHGDVVLARKDTPVAYHFSCCHDDVLQGISHVIRGTDLEDAPHIHVLIQKLMGWPSPIYRHHPVLLGEDGRKLSKRDDAKSLASLRAEGLTPADVRKLAGF